MAKGKSKRRKIVTGVDISSLSKARPTKIPQAKMETGMPSQPISFKKITIYLGIILAIVLIAYGNSVVGQFVLQDNYLQEVLRSKITNDNFWLELCLKAVAMPLMQSWLAASFAFDFQSFALQPLWYHLVNIILQVASCFYFYCLVFLIARRRSKVEALNNLTYEIPFLASALLACHPLAAESVAHITGREGVLSAANVFLSLIFFLFGFWAETSGKMFFGYIASLLFFLMGIWSGPEAMAIPLLAVTTILLLRPDSLSPADWLRQTWPEIVVMVLLIVATCILPFLGLGVDFINDVGAPRLSPSLYYASQLKALVVYYLRVFVAPIGLSVLPPFLDKSGWLDPFVYLGVAVLLLAVWAIYRLRNQVLPAFGLALFVFTWLPNLLIVQPEIVADRRFYLPLAGLSLVIAFYLAKYTQGKRLLKVAIPLVMYLSLIGLTIWRNFAWQSNLSLWQATQAANPSDPYVRAMVAQTYLETGKLKEARKAVEIALKLNKDSAVAYLTAGKLRLAAKDYPQAEELFTKAEDIAARDGLGQLCLRQAELGLAETQVNLGKFDKARDLAMKILMTDRNNIQANLIMGKSLIGLKQPMFALNFLNAGYKAERMNPSYLEPIAEAGLDTGVDNLVRNAYGAASMGLRVAPTENLRRIFAQSALETGHFREGEQMIDSLLKEHPENANYLYLKSCLEKQLNNPEAALEFRKKALQRDPAVIEKLPIKILSPTTKTPHSMPR